MANFLKTPTTAQNQLHSHFSIEKYPW